MTTMAAAQLRAQAGRMDRVPTRRSPSGPGHRGRTRPPTSCASLPSTSGPGKAGKGALLRREGLSASLLSEWRKQRGEGALAAFQPPRGRPPVDPVARENARLTRENARLREQLDKQAKVIEVQGDRSALGSRLASSSDEQAPSEPAGPTQTSR
jgi:transposase